MSDLNQRLPPCKGGGSENEGDTTQGVTPTGSTVCTRVCTSEPENVHGDARLAALIEAWPTLSEETRERILAIVQATI